MNKNQKIEIFSAIDLHNGQAVRLTQGDYEQVEIFFKNPVEVLEFFNEKGAKNLHIVDLDGAKEGNTQNYEVIKELVEKSNFFVQVGGGIRDEERIKKYIEIGVNRIILGTIAAENEEFLQEMVKKYGEKIAVSVDAKNQKVAVKGWTETLGINSLEFCKKLSDMGVKTIIYTDISKDGMLSGTNLEIYKKLSEVIKSDIIASGGITFLEEIKELKKNGIYGAIVGKAIYSGKLDLKKVIEISD